MTKLRLYAHYPATLLLLYGLIGNSWSDSPEQIEARLKQTTITLVQAIAIAEQHRPGIVYEAELEDDSFTPEYEIKMISNQQKYKITVDAVRGEVSRERKRD